MTGNKLSKLGLRHSLSLGALQSIVRLMLGFASIKVTAVCIGPAGLALVAQLNNFISLIPGVLANPAGTAIVRLGAEHHDDEQARNLIYSTAAKLVLLAAGIVAILLLFAAPWLSELLLSDILYTPIVRVSAFAIVAVAMNIVLVSALNSIGELALMAKLQVLSTLAGFVLFVPGAYFWGVNGALTGSVLGYVVGLAMTSALMLRNSPLRLADFNVKPSSASFKQVLNFYPMLIVHAALLPLTMLLVRNLMMFQAGLEATGYWQAGWRLSDTYLALLMTAVSMYYMPKLGALVKQPELFAAEVRKTLLAVVALTGGAALVIFVLRHWIVKIVLAPAFLPVVDLLGWQLIGDVFKMAAWVLAMTLTARMASAWFVGAEMLRSALFVGLVVLWLPSYGVKSVNLAYALAMFAQLSVSIFALRDVVFLRGNRV